MGVGWGGDPCVLVPREAQQGKHTVSHTLAPGKALPGVAEMAVWFRAHCLLSLAQGGPLNAQLLTIRSDQQSFANLGTLVVRSCRQETGRKAVPSAPETLNKRVDWVWSGCG